MILPGCQTSNSARCSKSHHLALLVALSHSSIFHHWPLLALLVALVLHYGDSADLNFAILYMIIDSSTACCSLVKLRSWLSSAILINEFLCRETHNLREKCTKNEFKTIFLLKTSNTRFVTFGFYCTNQNKMPCFLWALFFRFFYCSF